MTTPDRQVLEQELAGLKLRSAEIERQLASAQATLIPATGYPAYHATTGFLLGSFGAITSLLFNVVGSALVGQHPLRLIQVYLTFPLAERALTLENGLTLAIGCCLYLGTGMLLGIVFQLVLARFAPDGPLMRRMVVALALAVVVWLVSYYGILSWLQPVLFGSDWIVREVPWWVGALTHFVYGATMAFVYPLGVYQPYSPRSEKR
jgi:hypothetical protein